MCPGSASSSFGSLSSDNTAIEHGHHPIDTDTNTIEELRPDSPTLAVMDVILPSPLRVPSVAESVRVRAADMDMGPSLPKPGLDDDPSNQPRAQPRVQPRAQSRAEPRAEPRKTSLATDESQGSVREAAGASQQRLAIPKKRPPLPTWRDDGTGRFYAQPDAPSAALRRSQNATDNTDPEDGFYEPMHATDGRRSLSKESTSTEQRYSSLRDRYMQDERLKMQPYQQERAAFPDSVAEQLRRMSLRPDENAAHAHTARHDPFYSVPPSDPYWQQPMQANYSRQSSMAQAPGRPVNYSPYMGSAPSAQYAFSRAYDLHDRHDRHDRAGSMNPLSPMQNLFPRDPFERAATTAPFEKQQRRPSRVPFGNAGSPGGYLDQASPSRFGQFGGKPEPEPGPVDPRILVPVVSVTPECRAVEGDVNSFWVAIELFATLTQPLGTKAHDHGFSDCRQASSSLLSDDQDMYRFGYISNMDIKIVPSYQAEILEVIGKSSSLLTLLPGSRRLMVVHVHLDMTKGRKKPGSDYTSPAHKNRSDQLFKDLEQQLGATSREYMQVQLKYSHSGFPKRDIVRDAMGHDGGGTEVRTTIETVATAVVMHQSMAARWSEPSAPTSSPLVDVVAKHWGPSAAKEMAKRIATSMEMRQLRRDNAGVAWGASTTDVSSKYYSPKQGKTDADASDPLARDGSLDEITPRASKNGVAQDVRTPTERSPLPKRSPVPERPKISLRKSGKGAGPVSSAVDKLAASSFGPRKRVSLPQIPRLGGLAMSSSNVSSNVSSNGQAHGPAHGPANGPAELDAMPAGCVLPRTKGSKMGPHGPRQPIPEEAPRTIRRPQALESLKEQSYFSESEQSLERGTENEKLSVYPGQRNVSRGSTMSKRSGRWSWSGWFS